MKKIIAALVFLLAPSVALAEVRCVSATPTVDTNIYASGDLIGGKLTFSPAALTSLKASGYIVSAYVTDKAAQAVDLELVVFRANPSGTTFTDQAAFDPADSDLASVAAAISLPSASTSFAWNDNSVHFAGSLALPVKGPTLYGALVSRGTPTFASSSDVTVYLCVSVD